MILNSDQLQFQEAARDFAEGELKPNASNWEKTGLPEELTQKLGELGFLGLLTSLEYGGTSVDYLSYALIIEEIARGEDRKSVV